MFKAEKERTAEYRTSNVEDLACPRYSWRLLWNYR